MISVLSALARIPWARPQPEIAAFCARVESEARELGVQSELAMKPDLPDSSSLRAAILAQLALLARTQAVPPDEPARAALLALAQPAPLDPRLSEQGLGGTDPLGSIPAAVRTLYLDGLARVGPAGEERLAALARRVEVENALRGRALALLSYDRRGESAAALLLDEETPLELRVHALEVLIADEHPRVIELCKAQLAQKSLTRPRPEAGELYLGLRAVRFLSETDNLEARDLLPLYPLVQRPLGERAAHVAELRARLAELAEAARDAGRDRERVKTLAQRAGALFDFVLEQRLNALLDPDTRDERVDAMLQALETLRGPRAALVIEAQLVAELLALLLGEPEPQFGVVVEDPARVLFEPAVPLAEEVLLALGRTRDPLAIELVLAVLASGTRELRGHACLALGMCAQPALAPRLLPALLDEDPFVRFCASEALEHLTGRAAALDWMAAAPAERQAAAEEFKRWLLETRR